MPTGCQIRPLARGNELNLTLWRTNIQHRTSNTSWSVHTQQFIASFEMRSYTIGKFTMHRAKQCCLSLPIQCFACGLAQRRIHHRHEPHKKPTRLENVGTFISHNTTIPPPSKGNFSTRLIPCGTNTYSVNNDVCH